MKQITPLHPRLLFALVLALVLTFAVACADTSSNPSNPPDGDQNIDGDDPIDGDEPIDGDDATDGDVPECPDGEVWSESENDCVVPPRCPPGMELNEETGLCQRPVPLTCDREGYESVLEGGMVETDSGKPNWFYRVLNNDEIPLDFLYVQHYGENGGATEPGTYELTEADTSLATCTTCIIVEADCDVNQSTGELECAKTFMPMAQGSITLGKLGLADGEDYSGSIQDIVLQEVRIGIANATTPVQNGEKWCIDSLSWDIMLASPGYVKMEPRADLSCDYPEGPYYFLGPEPGQTDPEPGTVPPMGWPSAYIDGEVVGFDLGEFYCEHPEIKTLFILIGASWCGACTSTYTEQCQPDDVIDQLRQYDAEVLWVIGEGMFGGPVESIAADTRVTKVYGCTEGIRISDTDNTAGERVIWNSSMHDAIPWAAAIRTSDMKLTHEQSRGWLLNLVNIAKQNCEDAGGCTGLPDGDVDGDIDGDVDGDVDGDSETVVDGDIDGDVDGDVDGDSETVVDGDVETESNEK